MTAVVKWTFEDYWRGQEQSVNYIESGIVQQFTVPDGCYVVKVTLRGGAGGGTSNQATGGYVQGYLPVTPGEVLNIRVGGNGGNRDTTHAGAGGWNGGGNGFDGTINPLNRSITNTGGCGGGGASDIRQGGDGLGNRVAVAAGGGGNGGGDAPGLVGDQASAPPSVTLSQGSPLHPPAPIANLLHYAYGGSATTTAPGSAGELSTSQAGSLGAGGNAGNASGLDTGGRINGAGGGGAGYYGGGGGGYTISFDFPANGCGGGGGSNYTGGLDADYPISSARGTQISGANLPTPSVEVAYVQTNVAYQFEINPNDNGAVSIQKSIMMNQTTGPNRVNILQEGQNQAPLLDFSGVILTQTQLEAMETWYDRRVFIKITDDLGREYYGVFSKFTPKRIRRASNFWYHNYDAEFTLSAYRTASGNWLYGRVM